MNNLGLARTYMGENGVCGFLNFAFSFVVFAFFAQ